MRLSAVVCAVAALLVACVASGTCDSLRVDLGFTPAAATRASIQTAGGRQVIDRIDVEGFCSSVSSGDPALPCKLIYVALPPDADERSVSISPDSYSTSEIPGTYDVGAVPAAATSGDGFAAADVSGFGVCAPAERDGAPNREWYAAGLPEPKSRNSVYSRDAFYPAQQVRVAAVGRLRSWKVAVVEFWPYAYNPATGKLRVVSSGLAALSFEEKRDASPFSNDRVAAAMAGFVENRAAAEAWYGVSAESATQTGYAIITTSAIASASTALSSFAAYQSSKGFAVKIATESDWGGGTGDAAAEHIRAWLKANYQSLAIQYVLLIGGADPANGSVPMKMLWPRRWATSYREAPSDYYYADLTGNWDRDGDGYAGEEPDDFGTGGIDRIPEVYVGRIPYYGSTYQLDSILRKTVAYESAAPGPWAKTFMLPMVALDADTPSYQLGEQMTSSFVRPLGLKPDRIYDAAYGVSPEHSPCTYDTVQNDWANGVGLVFWMTHGSSNSASSVFASSRCAYLDDSRPAIVYMASCSNGKPEDSGNLGYCVLAHGGAATLSASRVSWYYLGQTDFATTDSIGGLGYQYARFLLQSGEPCGKAVMDARLANPVGIWPNHVTFNLYGDPSLAYKLPQPAVAVASVAAAKGVADGAWVTIDAAVLSRADSVECFVQDANRCAGIRVYYESTSVANLQPGSVVSVTGRLVSEGGMRVLENAEVAAAGESLPLSPLGVTNAGCADAKTFGLLVKVWGRVVSSSASSFVIADGSGRAGITIACHNLVSPPPVGDVRARCWSVHAGGRVGVCGGGHGRGIMNYEL